MLIIAYYVNASVLYTNKQDSLIKTTIRDLIVNINNSYKQII